MGLVDTFFGGGQEAAAKKMRKELEGARTRSIGYQQPYYDAGKRGLGNMEQALAPMADPNAFLNSIFDNYTRSTMANKRLQEGTDEINNQAAAMGLLGSGTQRKNLVDYTQDVIGTDQQQFLQNIMGILGGYVGGQNTLANYGANSGNILSQLEQGFGQSIGQARGQEELGKAAGMQSLLTTILNTAANAAMGGMGGGAFGGLGGALAGGAGGGFDIGNAFNSVLSPYSSVGQAGLRRQATPQPVNFSWGG
jgi:hypothetical protein